MRKRFLLLLLILAGSFSLVLAQNSETRNLGSFTRISVSEAIHVYLSHGTSESARIEVSGIDLDEVLTDIHGSTLDIHLDGRNHRNIDVDVYVTYRELEEIEVSAAASVRTEDLLKTQSLKVEASSAGDTDLEIDVENLEVNVSSSADVEISGKAKFQEVSVSSAGKYDGFDLESEEADITASSAGSARVTVTKRIEAEANSAGDVRYRGNPDKIYEDENSGGSVRKSN